MYNLKPEGSSPSHLSALAHLNTFQLAIVIEQYVNHIIESEMGRVTVQTAAARSMEQPIWTIWCRVKDITFSCDIPDHLYDWEPLHSMITQIKLTI
jgi:hypothetical protein